MTFVIQHEDRQVRGEVAQPIRGERVWRLLALLHNAVTGVALAVLPGAGHTAPQSLDAKLHHHPTPGSIAAAENKLGEGSRTEVAVAALARAREADSANEKDACERALADAQRAIGP